MKITYLMCIVALTACASTPPAPADFEAMVQSRYVEPFRSADLERWLEVFADDAVALHNRRPADEGKDAIRAFGNLVFDTFKAAQFDVEVKGVRQQGDTVTTWGTYASHLKFRATGEDAPWGPERGKFLFVWQRGADGVWRIVIDMGNAIE